MCKALVLLRTESEVLYMHSHSMHSVPIIFLHGFPFNGSAWDEQIAYFKSRYQVYAPDLRGHGTAKAPPGPWMIAHFAKDILEFMDEKRIRRAVLCGLSMGGYVALHFAAKYPDRLAGLVLCDTRADADGNEVKTKRFDTIQRVQKEGLEGFSRDFAKSVLSETTLRSKPEVRARVEEMITGNRPENVAKVAAALASRHDHRSLLSGIKCPSAVFVGSDDKVTPPDLSEVLAGGIEDAEFRIVEHAGHLSNIEQPEAFNRYLDEFLDNFFASQAEAPSA